MDSEQWQLVCRLFQAALEIDPSARGAFLDQNCAGDESLRREVESLLDCDQLGLSLIDEPAIDMVANLLGTPAPELSIGQHIGHYEIVNLLGSGGMGEVYLAHDNSLGRKIALKLLPADFTVDDERVRRFQQEARAVSGLNHPSILTIYEIGQFDNRRFIATEFIEGKTLRQIAKGSKLHLTQALDIGVQVASALAAAHRTGIVHRDIKPENIMVRPDGYVKILDFGLAKLTEPELSAADTEARTLEQLDTLPGMVLGTAKYMSPEQAGGLRVDGRSDIFSLGVVLYEMIAGRAPFEGETTSDLIASVLKVDPPALTEYTPHAPSELQRIINKALSKDKESRYQNVGDMLFDLKALSQELELESKIQRALNPADDNGAKFTVTAARIPVQTADDLAVSTGDARAELTLSSARYLLGRISRNKARVALTLLIAISVAAGLGYGVYRVGGWGKSSYFQSIDLKRLTTAGIATGPAISPDGKYVAYTEYDGKQQNLWVRQLATASNTLVASGTNIGSRLTYSPDGNYLYYLSGGSNTSETSLYYTPAFGGISQKLITNVNSIVAISPDGTRLAFTRDYPPNESAVIVTNPDGSEEKRLATRTSPQMFLAVAWSPDGSRLACVGQNRDADGPYGDVVELAVEGTEQKTITDRRWGWIGEASWLSDGSGLVITAAEKAGGSIQLWQIAYPDGRPRRITADLSSYNEFSLTKDTSSLVSTQLTSIINIYVQQAGDASTVKQITSGSARNDGFSGISWTPDGKIVYTSEASGHQDIWTMNPDGSNQKQITVDLGSGARGLSVSPDGKYIVFVSDRVGGPQVWRIDIDGSNRTQLTSASGGFNPTISPDGKFVIYHDGADRPHAWRIPIDGGEPERLTGPLSGIAPRGFSPDGKLVVYKPADVPMMERKMGIASSETGELIRILNLPRNIQWTPDGQAITFVDRPSGISNLWSQPLDGGPAKKLTDFKEYQINMFAWSRDGKYLAFSRGLKTSDIVLISTAK